ncbi:MAG: NAD(P)/FAD-dependent oxidoreductase [Elusimicrobiales bacterium]
MRKVLIIGAGPAGITAACELARAGAEVSVLEADDCVGGISRTVRCGGLRLDIGGHRFFSKSDTVMNWWRDLLPLQGAPASDDIILGRRLFEPSGGPDPQISDEVMLARPRVSRILYGGKFYNYPVSLSAQTLANLGPLRTARIGVSYLRRQLLPIKPERSLADFYSNRFGDSLYETFFRDYTEKVWGVSCARISPEWGAQRVKGLSVAKAVAHAARNVLGLAGGKVETSLIDKFWYPKFGPGQLWEKAASRARAAGAEFFMRRRAVSFETENGAVKAVTARNLETGAAETFVADAFISTMPVRDLIAAFGDAAPPEVRAVAAGLEYRDFITAGLLYRKIKAVNKSAVPALPGLVPDTWIYIQEPQVKAGRLQIFNNWSPYLCGGREGVWLGVEFFCQEGDGFWKLDDAEICRLAVRELEAIGFADSGELAYSAAARMPKTYPGYFGAYSGFGKVREFMDSVPNLYPAGRNGMHRYNNMDHSMLSAMKTAEIIMGSGGDKRSVWAVNSEEEYHESK